MRVSEVMTTAPITLKASSPVSEAARAMREYDVGDVVVRKDGRLRGIVTDRDIVVRVLAEGKDPKNTSLDDICTKELIAVTPDQRASDAAQIMREQAIRRLLVVKNDQVLGIVSLGDLAVHLDPKSALGNISAAAANR